MEEILEQLIEEFEKGPANAARRMRELLETDRDRFVPAALATLRRPAENRGYRYLVALLAGNDLLVPCICDPSLSLAAAITLARTGIQIDPSLDMALGRALTAPEGRINGETVRTLQVLSEISAGPRLVPLLTQLLDHTNPRVRSKAALLIARRNRSSRWVERRWEESDPRVRANALEGLWGLEGEGPHAMLLGAAQDPNNRVAGNALLGLHRAGDARSITLIGEMAAHSDARFRATAAWVMGETGDPRFQAALGQMMTDTSQMVRARAFRSLARIRQRTAALEQAARLEIYIGEARRLDEGLRQLRVAVIDPASAGIFPVVAPTGFIVTEDGRQVDDYGVSQRQLPATFSMAFGLPRRQGSELTWIETSLLQCLKQKRSNDQWAIVPYCSEAGAGQQAASEPPHFYSKAAMLKSLLEKSVPAADAVAGLVQAARLLVGSAATLSGERHLVLIGQPGDKTAPGADLEAVCGRARHNGVVVHGLTIGGGGAQLLETITAATAGRLLRLEREQDAPPALLRLFWGLQYQYEIQYRPEAGNEPSRPVVKVQTWSDLGTASDSAVLA